MRPAWRLAISSLWQRPSRTVLMVLAVMLSAMLIAGVSCALASVHKAINLRVQQTVGKGDIRIRPASGDTLDASILAEVKAWPGVQMAVAKLQRPLAFRAVRPVWRATDAGFRRELKPFAVSATAYGIEPEIEPQFREIALVAGRLPTGPGEVAVDELMMERLNGLDKSARVPPAMLLSGTTAPIEGRDYGPDVVATEQEAKASETKYAIQLGDRIDSVRSFKQPEAFTIVGVIRRPPFGGSPQCFLTLERLAELTDKVGRASEIGVMVNEGIDAAALATAKEVELAPKLLVQTTAKVTSKLDGNMESQELAFVLVTLMAFLAASFIITTGLSTGVTERQRELAILRAIGATKWQLAQSQLIIGALIGGAGSLFGVPLGVLGSWTLISVFRDQVPAGLAVSPMGLVAAFFGAFMCGLIGAAYPAWRTARVSPLEGMAARSKPVHQRTVFVFLAIGLALLAIELCIVFLPKDGQFIFWGYASVGLPAMFVGYFLLGVPLIVGISGLLSGPLSSLMGLPKHMLGRTIRATPYRFGFTAGAMMTGLAIMVAIWTQGGSILRDWLGKLDFPDAFVTGLALTPESQATIERVPGVTATSAITLFPVETDAFGVKGLQKYTSSFIAFEPDAFFRMANLTWVEPADKAGQERAHRRLNEGGAIIVAREFKNAKGLGVGDTFTVGKDGKTFDFEIVGVVTSPGLDLVSQFFHTGDEFTEQAIHAVFGSRADLKARFGSEAISMIQLDLAPDADDEAVMTNVREAVFDAGVIAAGSGRQFRADIEGFVKGSLLVSSSIAVFAMIVAGLGVANIVIAGVHARRYEFGVLRAVGAERGLVARLVISEAILVAIAAMILGTGLGLQGVLSGQRIDYLLFGLELTLRPPVVPILVACGFALSLTVLAAAPAAIAVARRPVRELLASVKG